MEKWLIKTQSAKSEPFEYYTGKSYLYQGKKYLNSSKDKENAKFYSTYKRAFVALRNIEYNFENSCRMEIVRFSMSE